MGMPFGTRAWSQQKDNICCNGQNPKDFRPCCHYRWYPWKFKMPVGWGSWGEWGRCDFKVHFQLLSSLKTFRFNVEIFNILFELYRNVNVHDFDSAWAKKVNARFFGHSQILIRGKT